MKYADCPTTEVDVTIAGSLDAVWGLVSDIELSMRFSAPTDTRRSVTGRPTARSPRSSRAGCSSLPGAFDVGPGHLVELLEHFHEAGTWTVCVSSLMPHHARK